MGDPQLDGGMLHCSMKLNTQSRAEENHFRAPFGVA